MRKKNSLLVTMICAMGLALVAGRCSDDDDKASSSNAHEAAPVDSVGDAGKTDDKGVVDSGVETDPLGETIGGPDDMVAPVEDPAEAPADDVGLDETLEPEPLPEESADL